MLDKSLTSGGFPLAFRITGVVLVSGAVTHVTENPGISLLTIIAGLILFTFGPLLESQEELTASVVVRTARFCFPLCLGIGMASGGIFQFAEEPVFGINLFAAGVMLSFLGYVVKASSSAGHSD